MTQQKAASLTSSLFARKGKASPASLLISELAAAEAESTAAAAPDGAAAETDGSGKARRPGTNGAGLNASGLNGSGPNGSGPNGFGPNGFGRRKPKPSQQLPLLAFAEAQETSEPGAEPEAPEPAVDLPPAASLLEPRLLRRPDRGAAAEAGAQPEELAEAAIEPAVDEVIEAEIVSGDANVAAIEDAPQDSDGNGEGAPDSVEESAEEDRNSASDAAAPEAVEPEPAEPQATQPEAAPQPSAAGHAAAPPDAAPSMPATLALRQAAALRTAGRAPAAPRPETMPPPAPDHAAARRSGAVWRSAAVLALGTVLGLGFYLVLAGEPAAPPPTAASAPDAPVPVTPAPDTPAVAAVPVPQAPSEPDVPAEAAPQPAPTVSEVPTAEPSFDVIRIEPDGQSIIAGRATPGSRWILLNNGSPIASVQADANGEWVVLPDAALVPGANAFSLVPKDERGRVAIPAPSPTTPETSAPDTPGPAPAADQAPEPRAEAPPALPKPKPLQAAVAPPPPVTFRAVEGGAYEVQLASVRQTADAERERHRLAAAFPRLLGALDLRVQEATLEGAGVFYRVRSGAIGELGHARELCRRLEVEGQGCLVVRRPEAVASEVADDVPDAAAAVRRQAAERPR